jgi:hypothetical protein
MSNSLFNNNISACSMSLLIALVVLSGCRNTVRWSRPTMPEDFEAAFKITHETRLATLKDKRCSFLSTANLDNLKKAGFNARIVAGNIDNDSCHSHTVNEVWIKSLSKWIMFDSLFDVYYTVDSNPATMLEIHNAYYKSSSGNYAVIHYDDKNYSFERYYENVFSDFQTLFYYMRTNELRKDVCFDDEVSRCDLTHLVNVSTNPNDFYKEPK